jgi:hypothetical protein
VSKPSVHQPETSASRVRADTGGDASRSSTAATKRYPADTPSRCSVAAGAHRPGLAQLANTHRQHPLTHWRLRPHGVEQGLFGYQLPRLADQTPQYGKGLGRESGP